MPTYAVGSWGVGNVGDDAILAGTKRRYGDVLTGTYSPGTGDRCGMTKDDLLAALTAEDILLFGGGGLFYDDAGMECFTYPFLRDCFETGCRIELSRCGLEPGGKRNRHLMTETLRWFHQVTVRSPWSLGCCHGLGVDAELEQDWAYDVAVEQAALVTPRSNVGRLIVAKLEDDDQTDRVRHLLQGMSLLSPITVLSHCPIHLLALDISETKRMVALEREFPGVTFLLATTWREALSVYAGADFVLTGRYHGAVFANAAKVEWEPYTEAIKVAKWNVI